MGEPSVQVISGAYNVGSFFYEVRYLPHAESLLRWCAHKAARGFVGVVGSMECQGPAQIVAARQWMHEVVDSPGVAPG